MVGRRGLNKIQDGKNATITTARTSSNGWKSCELVGDSKVFPARKQRVSVLGTKMNIEQKPPMLTVKVGVPASKRRNIS